MLKIPSETLQKPPEIPAAIPLFFLALQVLVRIFLGIALDPSLKRCSRIHPDT